VKIILIKMSVLLLAGISDSQRGLSHGTAICILRTENQIVIAADSREVNERNEPQKPVNKIIDLGGVFAVPSGMNRYGRTEFDAFALIHHLSGVRTVAEAIDRSERAISEPLANAVEDMRKNEPAFLAQYQQSPLSIVFVSLEMDVPVMAQIRFGWSGKLVIEKHRCPDECPQGEAAVLVGSDKSKKLFWQKYPRLAGNDLIEAARWFVQMEIDRGVPEIGPPVDILQITQHGAKWVQKKAGIQQP
jgi:hypothetical protein